MRISGKPGFEEAVTHAGAAPKGMSSNCRTLVLGVGNELCQDDGVGPCVIRDLAGDKDREHAAEWVDGGTVGLALLHYVQACDALIVVDAAALEAGPGSVQVFVGKAMDRFVARPKLASAHEVGLADLLGAAALTGDLPQRRALVAIEPGSTQLGSELTAPVRAAVTRAKEEVLALVASWDGGAP